MPGGRVAMAYGRAALLVAVLALLAGAPASAAASGPSVYATMLNEDTIWQFSIVGAGTLAPLVPAHQPVSGVGGIAISPDGSSLYLAERGAGQVGQFNVGSGGELTPKSPGFVTAGPVDAVAVSPDGRSLYASDASGKVWQYDIGAGGLLSAKSPSFVAAGKNPTAIAVSPDGGSVYVCDAGTETVLEFNVGAGGTLTPKAASAPATGVEPEGIVVSPDGTSVYVGNYTGGGKPGLISQYDVGAGGALVPKTPATVQAGEGSATLAISPDGRSVYVSDDIAAAAEAISQFDVGPGGRLSPKSPEFVKGPVGSTGIAVTADGRSVYVAASESGTSPGPISEFGVGAGGALAARLPAAISAGLYPDTLATTPDEGPAAAISALAAQAGSPSSFDGSGSTASYGPVSNYSWSFGDGTSANGSAAAVAHAYAAPGTYTVTLQVSDAGGCSAGLVFTGQTAYCNLDPHAIATATVTVPAAASVPAVQPPHLTGLRQSATRWREGSALARVSSRLRLPTGTTFSFGLDRPASVSLTFARRLPGVSHGGRCLAPPRHSHRRSTCTRFLLAGTLVLAGRAGTDHVRFQGRLSRTRKLVPGAYRLTAVALAADGSRSAPAALSFVILAGR